jgi:hypothetical protein
VRQCEVIAIPATKPDAPNQYLGTPGKTHVVGYALVINGTGAGVQIRKNIRRIIADRSEWELAFVTTDYLETEDQKSTCRGFQTVCAGIKHRHIDILMIHSAGDLSQAFMMAEMLFPFCQKYNVDVFIVHNDGLISEEMFQQMKSPICRVVV